MLFNSYEFIFVFLPIALSGYFLAARSLGSNAARLWLVASSLAFYAWWNPRYLVLIVGSMLGNFLIGLWLGEQPDKPKRRTTVLAVGLAANLALLGWYKYANFFLREAGSLFGANWTLGTIILPLGISFFTFVQITYLVDAAAGKTREYRFFNYVLFVTFFPHLIAGPIVHHSDLMPQFDRPETFRFDLRKFVAGFTLFTFGLVKKVLIADNLAPHAQKVFAAAADAQPLRAADAWGGLGAFTGQIYFDFSGYSDMAIGLGLLFGIMLPCNFDSPYKSLSMVEFWRRWHMTLSRFIRDYVYIPLGGNRGGAPRVCLNLMIAMVLAGLWHGANWTFIAWGAAHGLALAGNHLWRLKYPAVATSPESAGGWRRGGSWLFTFMFVMLTWVLFRADNLAVAGRFFGALAGVDSLNGTTTVPLLKSDLFIYLFLLLALVRLVPNTQQLLARELPLPVAASRWHWVPRRAWAIVTGLLFAMCVLSLSRISEFIYWQF